MQRPNSSMDKPILKGCLQYLKKTYFHFLFCNSLIVIIFHIRTQLHKVGNAGLLCSIRSLELLKHQHFEKTDVNAGEVKLWQETDSIEVDSY